MSRRQGWFFYFKKGGGVTVGRPEHPLKTRVGYRPLEKSVTDDTFRACKTQ
jgi:hypothetical protein